MFVSSVFSIKVCWGRVKVHNTESPECFKLVNPFDGSVPHRCAAPSVVPFALQQSALNFTGVSRRDDFRHHTADPPDGSLCLRLGTRRRTCVFATGGGVLPCGPGGHSSGLKGDAAQITSSSRRPAPPDAKVPGGPRGPARDRGSPSRAADGWSATLHRSPLITVHTPGFKERWGSGVTGVQRSPWGVRGSPCSDGNAWKGNGNRPAWWRLTSLHIVTNVCFANPPLFTLFSCSCR